MEEERFTREHRPQVCSPDEADLAGLRSYYQTSSSYLSHLEAKGPLYFERFVSTVFAHSSSSDLILDVGCGTGESSSCIAATGRKVIGSDISPLFLYSKNGARRNASAGFVASDAGQLPFVDCSVDVVCSMEMIEHVWPVDRVLDEMNRVLRPGGRIILMSPNLLSPLWLVRDLPLMLLKKRFRPPMYNSYLTALRYGVISLKLSVQKIFGSEPTFIPQIPDLEHADYGGDFDAVYKSHACDLAAYLECRGFKTKCVVADEMSLKGKCRMLMAKCFGSFWTSFTLVATKPTTIDA